jgi:hypothetical protein
VVDARTRFGRIDVLVVPSDAVTVPGRWIASDRLILDPPTDQIRYLPDLPPTAERIEPGSSSIDVDDPSLARAPKR